MTSLLLAILGITLKLTPRELSVYNPLPETNVHSCEFTRVGQGIGIHCTPVSFEPYDDYWVQTNVVMK